MPNFSKDFLKRLNQKKIKIAVVGLGYVGLPLAVEFAKKGFKVFGVDVDKDRILNLKKKRSYITDVSDPEIRKVISSKNLEPDEKFDSIKQADVVLICVPTPLKRKYHPDISFIKQAIQASIKNIKPKALIILESTTYPGTTEEVIEPMFEQKGLNHGKDFFLCFSPERIDPNNAKFPLSKIPKVIGGINKQATDLGCAVYAKIIKRVVPVSSPRVAETAKLLENTFRIVNIGLVDELAMMAHKMNIDIWEVIEAAKTKPFGFMPFYPGPGVGGHCIPKDPLYLYWKARHHGFKSRFIKLASDVINFMPTYVIERVEKKLIQNTGKSLKKAKILVIGVTYKKDVKDLRKSPSLDIIEILQKRKVAVSYFDPLIPYLKFSQIHLKSIELSAKKLESFDCVIIATDHSCIDYGIILKNSKLIFDSRNVYRAVKNQKVIKL